MDSDTLTLMFQDSSVRLAYVRSGMLICILSNDYKNRWPSRVLRENNVRIRVDGAEIRGIPKLVADGGFREKVLKLFREKYGEQYIHHYFKNISRMIAITPVSDDTVVGPDYYGWLESEFDAIADDYDEHILGNKVNKLLRDRSVSLMREVFRGKQHLLEIGCGTGTETIELLKEGFEITATDVSSKMLELLRTKAEVEGLTESLHLRKMRAGQIGLLKQIGEETPFQGAYSNYGALNCEHNLNGIARNLGGLVERGGIFVAGVYNRFCISEIFLYAASFQFSKALDRMRRLSLEGHSRFCIDVYAYTPQNFISQFSQYFSIKNVIGVPVIIPPSNLVNYVERFSRRFNVIVSIDSYLGKLWPLKYLGDHFLAVMKRNATPSPK